MAETLFYIGERVRVKPGAVHCRNLGHPDEMDKYGGNIYTVKQTCIGKEPRWYWLDECMCDEDTPWIFDESWLEPVENNTFEIKENEIENLFN